MSLEVEAFIFDKKIGTLLYSDGKIFFEYDANFKTYGLEISPLKLPNSLSGVYTNNDDKYFESLAGVFWDSLPDKFGTKVIQRYYESKNIPSYELNIIQKLMFIADKGLGAITYKPSTHQIDYNETKEIIEIQDFYNSAKKIISGSEIDAINQMLLFMDSAASAGGARAKAMIAWDKNRKQIKSALSNKLEKGFEHYLIKFDMPKDNGGSSDFTKLEYLYMSMAKESGVEIPNIDLLEHNGLFHYLIKRFDRVNGEKIHLHSVAGLTHTNFNIPAHYSYDDLFRLTRFITGEQSAVEEQYRRMIFNIISRNQDDHAKNFSFMMNEKGIWSNTPAYDITYANGQGYTKNHQFSLLGKVNNFNKDDLLQISIKHSINEKKAKQQIEKTIYIVSSFEKRATELEINSNLIQEVSNNLITFN